MHCSIHRPRMRRAASTNFPVLRNFVSSNVYLNVSAMHHQCYYNSGAEVTRGKNCLKSWKWIEAAERSQDTSAGVTRALSVPLDRTPIALV